VPDGSGLDLIRWIRHHGLSLPGIALTGYGQEEDVQKSREAGFSEHLTKPVNIAYLHEVLARF
jgi:CheY-like chemotaxis protein